MVRRTVARHIATAITASRAGEVRVSDWFRLFRYNNFTRYKHWLRTGMLMGRVRPEDLAWGRSVARQIATPKGNSR